MSSLSLNADLPFFIRLLRPLRHSPRSSSLTLSLASHSNVRVHLPFPVDSISPAEGQQPILRKTYLDSTGRPTIVLKKKDCSDRHGADVLVSRWSPFPSHLPPADPP